MNEKRMAPKAKAIAQGKIWRTQECLAPEVENETFSTEKHERKRQHEASRLRVHCPCAIGFEQQRRVNCKSNDCDAHWAEKKAFVSDKRCQTRNLGSFRCSSKWFLWREHCSHLVRFQADQRAGAFNGVCRWTILGAAARNARRCGLHTCKA